MSRPEKIINDAKTFFSKDEIQMLNERSDLAGWNIIITTWLIIAFAFALPMVWLNPLTIIISLVLLGGRQLAMAIIMHDGSHRSLFKTRWLNDFCSQWLSAYTIFQNTERYREYHLRHHKLTGTENDPDLPLANKFPVPKKVLYRNFLRDFSGIVGIKSVLASVLMGMGILKYQLNGRADFENLDEKPKGYILHMSLKNLGGPIIVNFLMWFALYLLGNGWLYLLWPIAFITVYMFFLRIRSIAEHALTPSPFDALQNARTTRARWYHRLTVAPLNVNYHLEHHMLMAVPYHKLPLVHKMLRERGAYDQPCSYANSYGDVIKQVTHMAS